MKNNVRQLAMIGDRNTEFIKTGNVYDQVLLRRIAKIE